MQVFLKASLFYSCINNDGSVAALSLPAGCWCFYSIKTKPTPWEFLLSVKWYNCYFQLTKLHLLELIKSCDKTKMHFYHLLSSLIITLSKEEQKKLNSSEVDLQKSKIPSSCTMALIRGGSVLIKIPIVIQPDNGAEFQPDTGTQYPRMPIVHCIILYCSQHKHKYFTPRLHLIVSLSQLAGPFMGYRVWQINILWKTATEPDECIVHTLLPDEWIFGWLWNRLCQKKLNSPLD